MKGKSMDRKKIRDRSVLRFMDSDYDKTDSHFKSIHRMAIAAIIFTGLFNLALFTGVGYLIYLILCHFEVI
jgi:hypothetical protein